MKRSLEWSQFEILFGEMKKVCAESLLLDSDNTIPPSSSPKSHSHSLSHSHSQPKPKSKSKKARTTAQSSRKSVESESDHNETESVKLVQIMALFSQQMKVG
jgi:hypothetical protein